MIIMTTILLLAGGKSTRMGRDKAMMKGGVNRLLTIYSELGAQRIITLCGASSRIELFEGEEWPDPDEVTGPLELLKWCLTKIEGDIQIIPCDAFSLLETGADWLLKQENGVPVDSSKQRQPLMARISNRELINHEATTINGLFAKFPSLEEVELSKQFSNFNTNSELVND